MSSQYITYSGPPTNGIWELGQQATDVDGNEWLCTARGVAGQPGTSFLQISTPPGGGGEVTKIIAGTGISLSPSTGVGNVTVTNSQTGRLESVVAGGGVIVSATDPLNPVVSASVTSIVAGSNVTLSPASGVGAVTVSAASASVTTGFLSTSPANSASVAVAASVAVHNTLGYDAILGCYLNVTAASVGTISVGVGSTSLPTAQTIVTGLTSTAFPAIVPLNVYVPSGYYFIVYTTGITATILGQWYPV